jgi:hypothetical protein
MCDHFFNFCVTAHSIRDWVIHTVNVDKNILHQRCNQVKELAACRDIANANKHFSLEVGRNEVSRGAVISRSSVVDVFENVNGEVEVSMPRETIELFIVIEGQPPQESHQFTRKIIEAWTAIFNELEIPVQSIHS